MKTFHNRLDIIHLGSIPLYQGAEQHGHINICYTFYDCMAIDE